MEKNSHVEDMLNVAIEKIKSIADSKTVVGELIELDGIKVVPVIKINIGLVAGGGEYSATDKMAKKAKTYPFAGGTGTGINIQPIGFLYISDDLVKYIKLDTTGPLEKFIDILPKVSQAFSKRKKENRNENK